MPELNYKQIVASVKEKKFAPIYILMGEEPFFINELADLLENSVLEIDQRSFNQTVIYGNDTDVAQIIATAKRFPMMANHQLVLVREAQNLKEKDLEQLAGYFEQPVSSTVLVLAFKGKTLDKRKKTLKAALQQGVVFTAEKIKDYQLPQWVEQYVHEQGYKINQQAALLFAEHIGNNLSNIKNEFEKLILNVQKEHTITIKEVETNIGINREYTIFELQNAIQKKDTVKAFEIVDYFSKNPKATSFSLTFCIATLYNWYNKLWIYYHMNDKSIENVRRTVGFSNDFFAKEFVVGAKHVSLTKVKKALQVLLNYDLRGKGVNDIGTDETELLKEMVFKLVYV